MLVVRVRETETLGRVNCRNKFELCSDTHVSCRCDPQARAFCCCCARLFDFHERSNRDRLHHVSQLHFMQNIRIIFMCLHEEYLSVSCSFVSCYFVRNLHIFVYVSASRFVRYFPLHPFIFPWFCVTSLSLFPEFPSCCSAQFGLIWEFIQNKKLAHVSKCVTLWSPSLSSSY